MPSAKVSLLLISLALVSPSPAFAGWELFDWIPMDLSQTEQRVLCAVDDVVVTDTAVEVVCSASEYYCDGSVNFSNKLVCLSFWHEDAKTRFAVPASSPRAPMIIAIAQSAKRKQYERQAIMTLGHYFYNKSGETSTPVPFAWVGPGTAPIFHSQFYNGGAYPTNIIEIVYDWLDDGAAYGCPIGTECGPITQIHAPPRLP